MQGNERTRIVVTGMGTVSPLGCRIDSVWARLLAGRSGLSLLPAEVSDGVGSLIGGQVPAIADDPVAGYDPW